MHTKVQGGCSGRLRWLQSGEGRGVLIAAMRNNSQVLVTPQQSIKFSQASSATKLAPLQSWGGRFHHTVQGAKARVATKCFGTAAAADVPVTGLIIRMRSTIASFHALVGFSRHLAVPLAI